MKFWAAAVVAFAFCFSAQAATVQKPPFELLVTWDGYENVNSVYRTLFEHEIVQVNPEVVGPGRSRSGILFETYSYKDHPSSYSFFYDGTKAIFKDHWFYFTYDIATGHGTAEPIETPNWVEVYTFGPTGGTYEYEDDGDPYLKESATLTNVKVELEWLPQVPIPAGGFLLLTGLLLLSGAIGRRNN